MNSEEENFTVVEKPPVEISKQLTDSMIDDALREILAEGNWEIELDDQQIHIEHNIGFKVIERVYLERSVDIDFGSHYRVLVAIGDLEPIEFGIVIPIVCFALLYYSLDHQLITCDFMPKNWWTGINK